MFASKIAKSPARIEKGAVTPFVRPLPLLRKLKIGSVNDPLEQEADQVADRVMRMEAPEISRVAGRPQLSRKCSSCEEEDKVVHPKRREAARRGDQVGLVEAPAIVHDVLRSAGRPVDPGLRHQLEPRFGYDFSRIRIHDNAKAAESANAVDALAYAVGENIVFGSGQYAPGTSAGRRLFAHELTHVVQGTASNTAAVLARQTKPAAASVSLPDRDKVPPRGSNPGECMKPLCTTLAKAPLGSPSDLPQQAENWHQAAAQCITSLAGASNASHAAEIQDSAVKQLDQEVERLNRDIPAGQLARRGREYKSKLLDICRRKQRETSLEFYFNVLFESQTSLRRWGEAAGEWDEIESALTALPIEATWGNPLLIRFRRGTCHPKDVMSSGGCLGTVGGETDARSSPGSATIDVFDSGLGKQPYARSSGLGLSSTAQTLEHEVGHVVQSEIPQSEIKRFYSQILPWTQYSWAWITARTSPYPAWQEERAALRKELGFDEDQLDKWLTAFAKGTSQTLGLHLYMRSENFLNSVDALALPSGKEFEYATTDQGEYLSEIYAFAVSKPEWLNSVLPPTQSEWLREVVFKTPKNEQQWAIQLATNAPIPPAFLKRVAQLYTWEQINPLLDQFFD